MHTCPACGQGWYQTYANGTRKEGYCQACGHETSVLSKEKDPIPFIHVEKPQSKGRPERIRRNK